MLDYFGLKLEDYFGLFWDSTVVMASSSVVFHFQSISSAGVLSPSTLDFDCFWDNHMKS